MGATSIKSGLPYELKWICDCARNAAPLIACSSSGTTSFVATPSGRVLPQVGYSFSGLSLTDFVVCIGSLKDLPFCVLGPRKELRTVFTRMSS